MSLGAYIARIASKQIQVREEFLVLAHFLKGFEPVNILEIGVGAGGSFAVFCQVSSGLKVALDAVDSRSVLDGLLEPGSYVHVQGMSQDQSTYEAVARQCSSFDFIFVDGDHSYEGVCRDFALYRTLLSQRGIMAFHDIDPNHKHKDAGGGQVYAFWMSLDIGTKTEIICQRSHTEAHFGGIGLWTP